MELGTQEVQWMFRVKIAHLGCRAAKHKVQSMPLDLLAVLSRPRQA